MDNTIDFSKLIMQPNEIDMVIYHGNCVDGFTSAFSAYKYFTENEPTKEIIYHPASFDKPPPDVSGKNVCLCDFTYKKNVLEDMMKKANKLIILDHHKTAQEDLENLPEENKIFCMNHSGAYITWSYFHPNKLIPQLILYVEDTDIWNKALPFTNEVSAVINMTEKTFEEYDKLFDDKYLLNKGFNEGTAILKNNSILINQSLSSGAPKLITINQQHYFVCHLNSSVFKSDIGNKIFDEYPNANFSAIYSIDDFTNSTIFSLRSTDERSDVSRIAKLFGGGGHRNASGIRVPHITSTLPGMIYDTGKLYDILNTIYMNSITINEKIFNIINLNLSYCKHIIARYLLQVRCFETDTINKQSKAIQEGISIIRNRNKKNNIDNNLMADTCHLSYVWNYDGNEDKTYITLYLSPTLLSEEKQSIIDYIKLNYMMLEDDDEQVNNKLVIVGNGLLSKLI
jgi:oligoribonuclease NrnB/cAMP/cGMP phosphodiesterase (DHH superfamily)